MRIISVPIVILVMLVASAVYAAEYFADFDTGSDANDGLSTSTPWKHWPGDPNATSTPASATISAADTLWSKGGIVYIIGDASNDGILISSARYANGASIRSGHLRGASYGAGRAIVDGNDGANNADQWIVISAMSSITVQGFEMRDTHTTPANQGAFQVTDSSGITIDNNILHDQETINQGNAVLELNRGTATENDGHIVSNNEIYNGEKALEIFGSGGNTVRDNELHGASDHVLVISSSNNSIYRNKIYDAGITVLGESGNFPSHGIKIVTGTVRTDTDDNLIYNNLIYNSHTGLVIENVGTVNAENNLIYNNTFHHIKYIDPGGPSSGIIRLRNTSTGRIHGNLFKNNIFSDVDPFEGSTYYILRDDGNVGNDNIFSENLWWCGSGNTCVMFTGIGGCSNPITLTNYSDNGTGSCKLLLIGTGNSFDDEVGVSSGTQKFDDDPVFVDSIGPTYNFSLQSSSINVLDLGTNLSGVFVDDYIQISRPQGSAWDIGAYEFVTATNTIPGVTLTGASLR